MRLVLLHALPFDGRMWRAERDLVPGESFAPSLYRLGATLEEWARAVLTAVGDDPLVVVGCSVGAAACALEIARAAPDQVIGLVLVGAKAGVRPDPVLRDEAVELLSLHGMEAAWSAYWRPLFGPGTPAAVLAKARSMALEQDVHDIIRGVRAFHDRRDLTDFAGAWPKPLVVISGELDRTPAPSTAAQAADGPNRQFHLVGNCGHYVNLERPSELRALLGRAIEACRDHP